MKISLVGAGYVGLVSGACFADKGHDVVCVDYDKSKVQAINAGRAPFFEPGLEELLARVVGKKLRATDDLGRAVNETEMTFIAVGTPFDGKRIDLSYVLASAQSIGAALREKAGYHAVVVKSTVVPGTTDRAVGPALEEASGKRIGKDFGLGMNPEFLTEGEAVGDFMVPDRIVCGGVDARTQDALVEAYAPFTGGNRLRTNNTTAEMIKYASNALLATLISFSNELANLSEAVGGADAVEVMRGLHASRYLTQSHEGHDVTAPIVSFLMGGCGFGGSCLPKDVSALVAQGRSMGEPMNVLQAVLDINAQQHDRIFRLLGKHFPSLSGKRVTVLGLSFRPDTNDMRESPAIPIIKRLLAEGALVRAYDPAALDEAKKHFAAGVEFSENLEQALENAEAVVIVTRWSEFRKVPAILKARGARPVVVDGRRLLEKESVERYEGIGLA